MSTTETTDELKTAQSRQEKQEALSRAMGAMFLQHRVETLEQHVEDLTAGGSRRFNGHAGNASGSSKAVNDNDSPSAKGKGRAASPRKRPSSAGKAANRGPRIAEAIYVVDCSVLVYSLRTVHEWLKKGDCRVVVPLEVLNSLDVLKKGDHPINQAARRAIRFLEERITAETQPRSSPSSILDLLSSPGLVVQLEAQKGTYHAFTLQRCSVNAAGEFTSPNFTPPIPPVPLHMRETLTCATWFAAACRNDIGEKEGAPGSQESEASEESESRHPPSSLVVALPPPSMIGHRSHLPRYAERADGELILGLARLLGFDEDKSKQEARPKTRRRVQREAKDSPSSSSPRLGEGVDDATEEDDQAGSSEQAEPTRPSENIGFGNPGAQVKVVPTSKTWLDIASGGSAPARSEAATVSPSASTKTTSQDKRRRDDGRGSFVRGDWDGAGTALDAANGTAGASASRDKPSIIFAS